MKTFDWTCFTRRIPVKADIQHLYHAWTKGSEIERWFLKRSDFFDASAMLISKETPVNKGYSYEWSWYLYEPVEKGRISEANGKDHVQFTFAGECMVDVTLKDAGENVIVEIKQSNIPIDDDSKQNIRLGCEIGWSFFLVNLKSVYEGGPDLRNKQPELKGMVNN